MKETFEFNGHTYEYFDHPYNNTRHNERAVEIPIVGRIVGKFRHEQILELGNVLWHYFDTKHRVIDKDDMSPYENVLMTDINDVDYEEEIIYIYDCIVSISSLENNLYPHNTLNKLLECKAPGGIAIITLRVGYSEIVDKKIINEYEWKKQDFLLEYEPYHWGQCSKDAAMMKKYDHERKTATAIMVGII